MKTHIVLVLTLLTLGLVGCSTVPETGRSQLMIGSPAEEAQMGLATFADIKKQEKISTNPAANAQVQRVGARIAKSVGRSIENAEWEFVVFDSPDVNAFALPGGKVGVYTGLLNIVASDDELACVMGHEIAHVTSRHGGERMSQQQAAQTGTQVLGAVLGLSQKTSQYEQLANIAYGVGAQGTLLAFSRKHETEADTVGLKFAAQAGYDPRAAATFWKKMAAASSGQAVATKSGAAAFSADTLSNLMSTHPSNADRIANLEKLAPTLMPIYEQAKLQYR